MSELSEIEAYIFDEYCAMLLASTKAEKLEEDKKDKKEKKQTRKRVGKIK